MAKRAARESSKRYIKVKRKTAERLAAKLDIGLANAVLGSDPASRSALEMLGTALTRTGRHEDALRADLRLTEVAPKSPYAFYNLACSHSNLGQVDEGLAALRKALDLGYRDFNFMMTDEDLDNVRRDPRFRKLLDRKWGKRQP